MCGCNFCNIKNLYFNKEVVEIFMVLSFPVKEYGISVYIYKPSFVSIWRVLRFSSSKYCVFLLMYDYNIPNLLSFIFLL